MFITEKLKKEVKLYIPPKKKKKSFINYAKNVYGKLCEIFVNYYD